MYICLCHPFTDKDVKGVLKDGTVRRSAAQVYKACTGGEKPCCGSCMCLLKDMVANHQDESELIAAE